MRKGGYIVFEIQPTPEDIQYIVLLGRKLVGEGGNPAISGYPGPMRQHVTLSCCIVLNVRTFSLPCFFCPFLPIIALCPLKVAFICVFPLIHPQCQSVTHM